MAGKRKEILQVATVLFAEKGYNETSMAELARLTGVAEGTIFYHFKTKTDLLLAILDEVQENVVTGFERFMCSQWFDCGMTMLEGVVAFYLYLVGQHAEWFKLIQRHYPYELARENDACRRNLEKIYNTLIDYFEAPIRNGHKDGSIRPVSARRSALLIFSMVNGLVWLRFHDLYDTGSLYRELIASCRQMLSTSPITSVQE
jgi:AcrR family transcriptional regulator